MLKPIIKWVGGKSRIADVIADMIPARTKEYYEPFFGSGAVFCQAWNTGKLDNVQSIVLGDAQKKLMNMYIHLRDSYGIFMDNYKHLIENYLHTRDSAKASKYYEVRGLFNSGLASDTYESAMLVFLNKTCYNGLFRTNKKGEFNTPFGQQMNPAFPTEEELYTMSCAFGNGKRVRLVMGDFDWFVPMINPQNTLTYLDPPYADTYNHVKFDEDDYGRLQARIDTLHSSGGWFILSQPDGIDLEPYGSYNIMQVNTRHSVSSDGSQRGQKIEYLIHNIEGLD